MRKKIGDLGYRICDACGQQIKGRLGYHWYNSCPKYTFKRGPKKGKTREEVTAEVVQSLNTSTEEEG